MNDISIPVSGASMRSSLFTPKMTPAPGVVILQEIFGVNEFVNGLQPDWLKTDSL